jgi:predicted acylesterase/phospholipase RssA
MGERLLVVGGGGARGAWGGGFAHFLRKKVNQPYRYVFGTSTGSLMAPLVVMDDFKTLKTAYTSFTQSSIFNVNPFKPDGTLKGGNAAWRFLTHRDTFGESDNLLSLIGKFLTPERYAELLTRIPEVQFTVCSVNFTTGEVEYGSSGPTMSYKDMCNWIWASANEPLFMTFVGKPYLTGGAHVDGGVRANVPIVKALSYAMKQGIDEIDIIINKPIDPIVNKNFQPDGILKNLERLIELWETEVRNSNIIIATLLAQLGETDPPEPGAEEMTGETPSINLHFHYIPQKLFTQNQNELIFDETIMSHLWEAGESGLEDATHQKDLTVLKKHAAKYIRDYPFPGKNY